MSTETVDKPAEAQEETVHRVGSDVPFYVMLSILGGVYVVLLVGMLLADVAYLSTSENADVHVLPAAWEWCRPVLRPFWHIAEALAQPDIRYSAKLTMVSCTFTAILSLLVAVPIGYLLSRYRFPGRNLLDAVLDIPIVLPPLVVGVSLLILFQFWPFANSARYIVFQIPAVIIAQFMVAAAFAIRIMRATFDQIDRRPEDVALTLGCTQAQAFGLVVLPQARHGMLTAGTLAWARALGEFGPLLIFAGTTSFKTEVFSVTVFLKFSAAEIPGAVTISLLMVVAAVIVLIIARVWGTRDLRL
jgi:molybdate transport system permease protein